MGYLREHRLDEVIRNLKQPVLGICIGQQLLCRHSEEGDVDCIGIFDADVKRFCPERHEDKVPCMGWNGLRVKSEKLKVKSEKLIVNEVKSEELRVNEVNEGVNPLFQGVNDGDYVYFVHSYYVPLCTDTIATANYILPYSAALHKDNFYTCQFHPEKSGAVGEQILRNFLKLK